MTTNENNVPLYSPEAMLRHIIRKLIWSLKEQLSLSAQIHEYSSNYEEQFAKQLWQDSHNRILREVLHIEKCLALLEQIRIKEEEAT